MDRKKISVSMLPPLPRSVRGETSDEASVNCKEIIYGIYLPVKGG